MTEVDEWISEVFTDRIEGEEDLDLETIQEWYDEKLEEYSGHDAAAKSAVQGKYNAWVNTGADGEVQMVTIGPDGPRPFGDTDMLFGFALAIPDEDPAQPAVILFDESNVDHQEILPYFQEPYQAVKGEFDIRSAGKVNNSYVMEAVPGTEVEHFEPERDRDGRKEMVDDFISEAKIADIGQHLSVTNDDGYPADYGVDLRRISDAYVLESRVSEKAGRYEVQDDSFVDARDLDEHIRGDQQANGLVCWVNPDAATFGEGSVVDLYGVITTSQETGQVTMNVIGVDADPQQVNEIDRSSDSDDEEVRSGSGGAEDTPAVSEERTI